MSAAKSPGDVIETAIWISVSRRERALAFYERLLGFQVRETRAPGDAELRLNGVREGTLTQTVMTIPGTAVTVVLAAFTRPARQDVGGSLFLYDERRETRQASTHCCRRDRRVLRRAGCR